MIAIGVVLNLAIWYVLIFHGPPHLADVALHYNIYFGIDFVGPWWYLLALPGIGVVVLLVNTILSIVLYGRETVVAYFLLGASVFLQLLLGLAALFSVLKLHT